MRTKEWYVKSSLSRVVFLKGHVKGDKSRATKSKVACQVWRVASQEGHFKISEFRVISQEWHVKSDYL